MDKINYTDPVVNATLAREIMGWTADVVTARDGSVIVFSDIIAGGTKWNPTSLIHHAMLVAEELAGYPWSCVDMGIDHDSFNEEGGYWCKFPPVLSSGTMELLSQKPCEARAETMAMAICKAAMMVIEYKNQPLMKTDDTVRAWTWSIPTDDNDMVRGSTEDGWVATIQLVKGKGWHVKVTSRDMFVFGSPCSDRRHGMFQAQELRQKDKSE